MRLLAIRPLALLLPLAVLGGCGGDDDDDTAAVDAAGPPPDAAPAPDAAVPVLIEGSLEVDNSRNLEIDSNHRVNASVRITQGGEPVINAVVRINPAPPAFQVFLTGEATDPSLYTGSYMGYHGTARIEVTIQGEDIVPETTLVGIQLFHIDQPSPGALVPVGEDLAVAWSRNDLAAGLRVGTDGGYDSGELEDATEHTVPGTELTEAGNDRVVVRRWLRSPLDTAEGSHMDFGVLTAVPIDVEAP